MSQEKTFTVVYRAEVKRIGYVDAKDENEAREKFNRGEYEEGHEVDCYNIEDIRVFDDGI